METYKTEKKTLFRYWNILDLDKKEISSVYFYAVFSGLVQLSLPLGVQTIIGLVMGTTMVTSIYILVMIVVLGVFMVGWLQISQMKVIEKIQQKLFTKFALDFANLMPQLKMNETSDYYLPEKTNRFFETVTIQKGLSKLLLDIPLATIQIVFGLSLLALYHPAFILFGALLIFLIGLTLKLTGKYGISTSLSESKYKYSVAAWLQDIARNVIQFKFNNYTLNLTRTDDNLVHYLIERTKHFKVLLIQYKTLVFLKVAITLTMLSVGTYLVISQKLNIGEFIAAEIVILTVISAVEKLIGSLDDVYDVITGIEKLSAVTELPIEKSGSLLLDENKNGIGISLQNLTFGYHPNDSILKNISIEIPSGAKVHLSGNEGSGKSTLIKLISGCISGYTGNILYNNVPSTNYQLNSLRKNIGLHLGSDDVFFGTVLENITLGNPNVNEHQILELADKLGMGDFLSKLNYGFDTIIDPTGQKLTGTALKKILLIRSLVGNKKLLLLNEPFLGTDAETRVNISNYLNSLNYTTIIITSKHIDAAKICSHQLELTNGSVSKFNRIN